ncbi:tetratricopeptide repeat (TPR)-like superfamily protein [Actinidia rufa]|uniref:Tetratricopeptide repeat (TPR)-like superfamily protein n=1 Tax=Actinidia rufa TaxID=165716 RepID=A0A7J0DRX1_9ERIC|nr:tetratricopeptide repeat (TPR)-like superfamily protein [Actinidia rufa]
MRHIKQIQSHLTVSGAYFRPFRLRKASRLLRHLLLWRPLSWLQSVSPLASSLHLHVEHHDQSFRGEESRYESSLSLQTDGAEWFFTQQLYFFFSSKSFVLSSLNFSLGLIYHAQAVRLGWESYDFVQNGLIHLYATCSCMDSARKLFETSLNRDVITWTAVMNGYVKSGQVGVARELFDEMPEKNEVSWSAMITGYAQVGLFKEALELFNDMQLARVQPNHAGIVGALSACAFLGALDQGRWIHAYINKHKMGLDRVLGTALIDMYAKCGCMEAACRVFDEMPNRDVYAFTSLILGLANHGQSACAIELLTRMKDEGVKPNEVTFICILSACSRMGLVEEGLSIFEDMKSVYGIEPGVQHYGCLVDLLGRAGMLEQAKKVVREMPMEPDSYVLGALLNACRVHGNVELGEEMVHGLVMRSLDHDGVHVLLSNIYASANQWYDVEKVRKGMEEKKVKKVPGCSLIEVDGAVCEFIAGDTSHALMEEIVLLSVVTDKHLKALWFDDDDITMEQVVV